MLSHKYRRYDLKKNTTKMSWLTKDIATAFQTMIKWSTHVQELFRIFPQSVDNQPGDLTAQVWTDTTVNLVSSEMLLCELVYLQWPSK